MTADKLLEVCDRYRQRLTEEVAKPRPAVAYAEGSPLDPIGHLRRMLPQIEDFVLGGEMDKAFRWLGFVQGVLRLEGIYTLDELREHNRPTEEG